MDVEGLALVDKGTAVGSKVEYRLLADLPDGLVDRLELVRDSSNCRGASEQTVADGVADGRGSPFWIEPL